MIFVQQAVVKELHISSAPNLPNVFLVDITSSEVDGVRGLLRGQAGVTAAPELVPVVSSLKTTVRSRATRACAKLAAAVGMAPAGIA